MGTRLGWQVLPLDQVVFSREQGDGGRGRLVERDRSESRRLLSDFLEADDDWVVEGVYGRLIERVLESRPFLVWIDRSEEDCLEGLRVRSARMLREYGRDLSPLQNQRMVERVKGYRDRSDHLGYACHRELYESYSGEKIRLTSILEIDQFLEAACG